MRRMILGTLPLSGDQALERPLHSEEGAPQS